MTGAAVAIHMRPRSRRALLRSLGPAAVGVIGGCSDLNDGETATPTTTVTETATPTETPSETPTETDTPTEVPDDRLVVDGPGPLPDAAWPSARRGVTNGGYHPDGAAFDASPAVDWRVETTLPDEVDRTGLMVSHPVLTGGRLFVAVSAAYGTHTPLPDCRFLRAIDPESGDRLWQRALAPTEGEGVKRATAPAVWGASVLAGAGSMLYAVDPRDGERLWARSLPDRVESIQPGDDRVYVAVDGSRRAIYVLDGDGDVVWDRALENYFRSRLAVANGHVYAGTSDGLYAFDQREGDVLWSAPTGNSDRYDGAVESVTDLVAVAGGLYAVVDGDAVAFHPDGEIAWHSRGEFQWLSTDGSRLYGVGTGETERVRALDAATGERLWEQRSEDFPGPAVATDGSLLLEADHDRVVGLDPATGASQWELSAEVEDLTVGRNAIYGVADGDLVGVRPTE